MEAVAAAVETKKHTHKKVPKKGIQSVLVSFEKKLNRRRRKARKNRYCIVYIKRNVQDDGQYYVIVKWKENLLLLLSGRTIQEGRVKE